MIKHISKEEAWEVYERYRKEVYPYISAVYLRVFRADKVKKGVELAEEFLSTLGNSYEEVQLRTLIEDKIQNYRNTFKKKLSLKDILIEQAYATKAPEILEKGLRAADKLIDDAYEAYYTITKSGLAEDSSNLKELGPKFEEKIREIWNRIEDEYGEEVELVVDENQKRKYHLMAGRGKVIFGVKDVYIYYDIHKHELLPRWGMIIRSLLEEYFHALHYRRIKELPPYLVNMRPHSEEIWVFLEISRELRRLNLPLNDREREIWDLDERVNVIGTVHRIANQLADLYLFEGRVDEAKAVLKEFLGKPVDRYDWDVYLREYRGKNIQMIVDDPREELEYRLRDALQFTGAEPMERWLNYGKISSRAMELLGLL